MKDSCHAPVDRNQVQMEVRQIAKNLLIPDKVVTHFLNTLELCGYTIESASEKVAHIAGVGNMVPAEEVLAEYNSGNPTDDPRREWHSQGAWLWPGDRIIVQRAACGVEGSAGSAKAKGPEVANPPAAHQNAEPQSEGRVAESQAPATSEPGDDGIAPILAPALPHHIVDANKMVPQPAAEGTPRTDAVAFFADQAVNDTRECAPAEFARTLERENAALQKIALSDAECRASLAGDLAKAERELAEAKDELKRWDESYARWCVLMVKRGVTSFGFFEDAINALYDRAIKAEAEIAALKHDIERAVAENTRLLNDNSAVLAEREACARIVDAAVGGSKEMAIAIRARTKEPT